MENPQKGPIVQENDFDPADIEKSKVYSALAYLGILFFLPLVLCPDSKFGRFHANQGLVLLLFGMGGSLVLGLIPLLGGFLVSAYGVLTFVLFVIGLVNTLNGKAKELPVIGSIHIIK